MGKKPRPRSTGGGRGSPASPPRDRVVDALMRLLAERRLGSITLADIAAEADVSLGELREAFVGKSAILAAFSRRIDRLVLDGGAGEGDTPRDRVFDVMMRRFDALAPHKDAIRSLARTARCDPCLAGFLACISRRSIKWMMVAADADRPGVLGAVAAKGLALVYADVARTWLDDDDPGLAKTMAALDRGLERGARIMDTAHRICACLRPLPARDRASRPGAVTA